MGFSYKSATTGTPKTTFTSTTLSYPSGSAAPVAGDALFIVMQGYSTSASLSWAAPSGWSEVGSRLVGLDQFNYPTVSQVFWKIHDTGTSQVVAAPSTGSGRTDFVGQVLRYSGSGTAAIVGTPVDEVTSTTVSTFQPTAFNPTKSATVISVVHLAEAASASNISYTTANGFTRRVLLNSAQPAGAWGDTAVTSGEAVTMPVFTTGGSFRFMAKTFALDRQPSGWSVGQIKY